MAVFSMLRSLGLNSLRNAKTVASFNNGANGIRNMSVHKRVFPMAPSRFVYNKFKDEYHFYLMLGIIPLGAIILYSNIYIGHAELAEIPEDYEPKHWEYHKNPIKRFFARYVYNNPQQEYEKFMHFVQETQEMAAVTLLERKVKELMQKRDDYQAWYYEPVTARYHRQRRRQAEELAEFQPLDTWNDR